MRPRLTIRTMIALLCTAALTTTALAAPAARSAPAPARTRWAPAKKVVSQIRSSMAQHRQAQGNFWGHMQAAVERGDAGLAQTALRYRAEGAQHRADAYVGQAKVFKARARREAKAGNTAKAELFTKQANKFERRANLYKKALANYEQSIPEAAQRKLNMLTRRNTVEPGVDTPTRSFAENKALFKNFMAMKDMPGAGEALVQMKRQAKQGNLVTRKWRRFQVWRNEHKFFKADGQLARVQLKDQINGGSMSASAVNRLLSTMEKGVGQGNLLQRAYKRARLGMARRQVRQAAERQAINAIRDGSVGWSIDPMSGQKVVHDANLLALLGDKRALRGELKQAWSQQKSGIDQELRQHGIQPGTADYKANMRAAQQEFFGNVRQQLQGSGFVEGLRVLGRLDKGSRRLYSEQRGVRSWVNKQVRRFSSWVIDTPLGATGRVQRELVNHARRLTSKKDVNSHLQASALMMTASNLGVSKTRKFDRVQTRAVRQLKSVIKQAVKQGDPDGVGQAYDLYQAYGMDAKGRAWQGPGETTLEFRRDKATAERVLVDRLSKLAEMVLLRPKEAAQYNFGPDEARVINARARQYANDAAAALPGSVPKSVWRRLNGNDNLLNRTFSGKMRRLAHSKLNPLGWPVGIARFILSQPLYLVSRGPHSKLARELHKAQPLLHKYVFQAPGNAAAQMTPEMMQQMQQQMMMQQQQQQQQQRRAPAQGGGEPMVEPAG